MFVCPCMAVFQPLDGLTGIFTGSQVRIFERDWPASIYNFMFSLPGLTCKYLADTKTLGFHFSSAHTTDFRLVDIRLNTHISITCDTHFHFHLFPFP